MIKFEKVSRFANTEIKLPTRATMGSAGYDLTVAEDVVILPYDKLMHELNFACNSKFAIVKPMERQDVQVGERNVSVECFSLEDIAKATKETKIKPTLVSTGVKAYMPKDVYLELAVRSSCPLKYWLVMANGVGIIDSDYADNPQNEGEIFLQLINFGPVPIILKKGDVIGQGIFKPYLTTDSDSTNTKRSGGFGSTNA